MSRPAGGSGACSCTRSTRVLQLPARTALQKKPSSTSRSGSSRRGGGYRFLPARDEAWPPSLSVLLGARYWNQSLTLETNGNPEGDIKKDWIDPFVGLRAGSRLSPRFFLNLRGDVGGFDISDGSSDISWNLAATVGYDVSRVTSIWAGYPALYVKYDEGLTEQLYAYDMTMQGILLGAGFRF